VSAYCLSPDGKAIAVSSWDETLRQWMVRVVDVETGKDQAAFKDEHGGACGGMALSSEGVLAWGRRDGAVSFWDVGWKAPGR
jgi:WD40 repeat protein